MIILLDQQLIIEMVYNIIAGIVSGTLLLFLDLLINKCSLWNTINKKSKLSEDIKKKYLVRNYWV